VQAAHPVHDRLVAAPFIPRPRAAAVTRPHTAQLPIRAFAVSAVRSRRSAAAPRRRSAGQHPGESVAEPCADGVSARLVETHMTAARRSYAGRPRVQQSADVVGRGGRRGRPASQVIGLHHTMAVVKGMVGADHGRERARERPGNASVPAGRSVAGAARRPSLGGGQTRLPGDTEAASGGGHYLAEREPDEAPDSHLRTSERQRGSTERR
jgi:hypothetical protein